MGDPARLFFKDPSFDGQLMRTLATAAAHSADLGEAMATARRVGKLNGQNWYDGWTRTATDAMTAADRASAAGDMVSARHALLRASEYHRQAFYYVRSNLDDHRLRSAYRAHVETFAAAAALMDHPAERVDIPYEGTTLPGYLFAPDDSGVARPTLIQPCGYDSTKESGWYDVVPALERGYNVLVFDGPGQGAALYDQRLYFRFDWEAVLVPVLDWLLIRPDVDPARIGLVGRSFAGYLAPRAAAFEHRLAALVCDPAQPDMAARLPDGLVGMIAAPLVRVQTKLDANRAEFFGARMATHNVSTIKEYFVELRRFSMLAHATGITCPTLIIEAENDFAGGSGQLLRDAITAAPAELITLTAAAGADGHCAGLGQEVWAGVVYPWLERTLLSGQAAESSDRDATSGPSARPETAATGISISRDRT